MKLLPLTFLCAVAALASIASCVTTASIHTLQPIEENLSQYKNAIVVVTASPQSEVGFQYVETRLKFAMLDKLRASKKFQNVTDQLPSDPADSDLKIVVTVTSLGSQHPSSLYGPNIGIGVGGVFSGGAVGLSVGSPLPGPTTGLIVQVGLFNAQTGQKLGYIDASATSGGTAAQAEAITDKVVAEIAAKAR